MRRILVLRGGALGDFIVTLPALLALRTRWPEAVIELAGNAAAAQLAVQRKVIDKAHSQHESRWAALYAADPLPPPLASWLAEFDLIVNFWPDPEGSVRQHLPVRAGQQCIHGEAMPLIAPAAAHYVAVLKPLGIAAVPLFCRIDPHCIQAPGDEAAPLPPATAHTIAIHPGSGSPRKNWPAERWLELMQRIDSPLLLVLGEAEEERWNERLLLAGPLAARLRSGSLRIAVGLSLEQLADSLRGCGLFLGHDSGVSHLAAACGVPSLLLFGPTDPEMWAPPAAHVRVLRRGTDLGMLSVDEMADSIFNRE